MIKAEPSDVDPLAQARAGVLLDQGEAEPDRQDANRNVDEEDPVPVDRVGEDASGEQADRASGRGDEGKDPKGFRLLAGARKLGHDDRDNHRGGNRAADPLNKTGGDQQPLAVGNSTQRRGAGEQSEAADEDLLAADQIPKTAG